MESEFYQTASSVAAHAALTSISVVIYHLEIITVFLIEKQQAVCSNTESTVAQKFDTVHRETRIISLPVIKNNKVVSSSLVFMKIDLHGSKLTRINRFTYWVGPCE